MFPEIINDLIAKGLAEGEIGQAIGMSQPSINRIKLGKQKNINFAAADALRKLHRERCPEKHEAAA